MVYTTRQLITDAYNLVNVVSEDFETVTGAQRAKGLRLLNAYLAVKTANNRLIPYYKENAFNTVVGQETYFVEKLILPETLTFTINGQENSVRLPSSKQGRKKYFGTARANGVRSLPFTWHYERVLKGSNIYLYFKPDQIYPIKVWGKFSLDSVTMNQDLMLTLDDYYIEFLRLGLGSRIAADYGAVLQPQTQKLLDEYESSLIDVSVQDLSPRRRSYFGVNTGINWGDVNDGRGWRPVT